MLFLWSLSLALGLVPLLSPRRSAPRARAVASEATLPESGGPTVHGTEDIMRPKQHGSTAAPVQATLRWDVDREVADNICSFNREGAEPSLSFTNYQAFTKQLGWQRGVDMAAVEPTVYYDSVSGAPLFVAPRGRTVDDLLGESLRHGWPSFRREEVVWEHVRVLDGSEVVSATGTHLGHLMPDEKGARFCINLCSIAGQPAAAAEEEGGASGSLKAAWPLLHELAAAGPWQGRMHYASGAEGMTPAPFVLEGTFHVTIDGGRCRVTSSVVLPGGVERVVSMAGELADAVGSTARLEKEGGGGPISLLLCEHTDAGQLVMRELNATTGESVLTSSMVLIGGGGGGGGAPELLQTSHELTGPGREVGGVQMWRMSPSRGTGDATSVVEHDEEAFMYSGSQL